MKTYYLVFVIVSLALGSVSCKRNPLKVDISAIKNDVKFVRFDDELFAYADNEKVNSVGSLREKHPDFFDLFTYRVIRIGGIEDDGFQELLVQFTNDTMITNVRSLVKAEFHDLNEIEEQINTAFKYYQYHFPKKKIPDIYTFVSGFNQSVVTAEGIVGVSLDKYLGRECHYYKLLSSTPRYKVLNMHKKKVTSDVAYAWAITEFEPKEEPVSLLDQMIFQGKMMYCVDAMLPDVHDSLKIGYTAKQLEWCELNEAQMWANLIERNMIYSNKRMDIKRYMDNAPTTSGFPLQSPGRTGIWIGWQIVRKYMKEHPETKLNELMNNSDYRQILNDSGYFPE